MHRSIYLAMMIGASTPVIPLHALCIDAPQICGISGMRIGRCLSEFGRIHFLARRCIRFESFVGNDCSSKTTSQPRKHLFTLRIIFGHCHDTEQKVAVNTCSIPSGVMGLSEILARRFVSPQLRYATIRTFPILCDDACPVITSSR